MTSTRRRSTGRLERDVYRNITSKAALTVTSLSSLHQALQCAVDGALPLGEGAGQEVVQRDRQLRLVGLRTVA